MSDGGGLCGDSGGCRCWRKREVKNSYEREQKMEEGSYAIEIGAA